MICALPVRAARFPTPPRWWMGQAACIHRYEAARGYPTSAAAWPHGWDNRSNPSSRGGMQFLWSTWRSAGGHGDPASASRAEQLWRAWLVWKRDGGSWHEWSTASLCGLR